MSASHLVDGRVDAAKLDDSLRHLRIRLFSQGIIIGEVDDTDSALYSSLYLYGGDMIVDSTSILPLFMRCECRLQRFGEV